MNTLESLHTQTLKEIYTLIKYCKRCGKWKPVTSFSKDKHTKDGYQFLCKECNIKNLILRDYKPCIYKITNLKTNKVYIGSTVRPMRRRAAHFADLKFNKHVNSSLQKDYNLYGRESFQFEIIEYVPEESLLEKEIYWLSLYKNHYNSNKKVYR